jgi:signal transduction histidine kinase
MSDNNYQEVIKNNKLFDGIPIEKLNFPFEEEKIIKMKEGEIIFQKGDESKFTYLVLAGRVKIKIYIENKSVKLNKTQKDFFGEIELLEDTFRRSAAVANTDCILYSITKNDLLNFITGIPEINDNIIAYNKVEIPELQIAIHPDLLKKDTDKIYVDSFREGSITPESKENLKDVTDDIIYDWEEDKIAEEKPEPETEIKEEIEEETTEGIDELSDTDVSTGMTDSDSLSGITEAEEETGEIAEEKTESEAGIKEEADEEITEEIDEFSDIDISTGMTDSDSLSGITEAEEETDELAEEKTESETGIKEETEEEITEEIDEFSDITIPEDITDSGITSDFTGVEEESFETDTKPDITPTEENLQDETLENEEDISLEINDTEEIDQDKTDEIKDAFGETENISEVPEEESYPEISQDKDVDEEKAEWINLTTNKPEEEIPAEVPEEEKENIEAEKGKLKFDDTVMNTQSILQAVIRINSGLNERTVRLNIVREAVKVTDAQAGALYLVDNVKKLLITEVETEDGYIDTSYPIGIGLTGLAAETGEVINIREPIKDFRYSEDIDSIRGIVGSSLLCIPVLNEDKETIAVICLANSSSGKFLISDEEKMFALIPHISQTLQNLLNLRQLLNSNRDIYLSTLTKFITENIQTPVLTMKYYAGQIKKKSMPADVKTVLNVLMDQADSVVNFLQSVLAFTESRNPLQIEEYDLQQVIDNALGLLAEYVESRNVTLYKKVESDIKVKVDKKAFYQACLQIAKNACDAMGESGNIYITAKRSGDLINIEFRDTGPGIPDELKTEIFQPFLSFNKENGTGLGLSIAQKIIRDHGGELTVESSPGEGATFIISLPSFEQY